MAYSDTEQPTTIKMPAIQNKTNITEKKTIDYIKFRRPAVKHSYQDYEFRYDQFEAYVIKEGWQGNEIKNVSIIKKMWNKLVASGEENDGNVIIDNCGGFEEATADDDDDDEVEDWDEYDVDEVWEYITEDVDYGDCFAECADEECSSPEQKEAEKKTQEEREAHCEKMREADRLRKIAEEVLNEERRAIMAAEKIDYAPEAIRQAILSAADLFKNESITNTDEMKIKALKNDARNRLLDQMKDLVVQLKMISKW